MKKKRVRPADYDAVAHARSMFERLYSIPTRYAPHGALYLTCKPEDWPMRRIRTIQRHPELFVREPVLYVKRTPI